MVRVRGAAAAKKKGKTAAKKKKEKNDGNTWEQPRHPVPFAEMPGISDALRQRLEELSATEPSFVIGKSLEMSDVHGNQARLLFSCKRGSLSQSPVTAVFTKTEMQFVLDKETGLLVTAFDREGRSYNLTFKYLESNNGYRFITGWKPYVRDNNLGVDMRVELWSFRSRKLPNRLEAKKVPVMVESGHPDGSVGLVLLHYAKNDLLEPEQAGADEPDQALPAQEMDSTEISEEDVRDAARGLLKLREYYSRGGGRARGEPES